jgi:hypothetical protein
LLVAALLGGLAAGAAMATSTTPAQGPGTPVEELKRRAESFPQPVLVAALAGRSLLGPAEAQPLYGRVASPPVVRGAGGALFVVVTRAGRLGLGAWLGWGGTPAAVPPGDVALMGEHVVLVGLTREELDALPAFQPAGTAPIAPDAVIRIGIVGPFH